MTNIPPTRMKKDVTTGRAYVRWKNRKYYFGKWNSQAAAKKFAKWMVAVHTNPTAPAPPSDILIVQCAMLYLDHAKKYYSTLVETDGEPILEPTGEYNNIRSALMILIAQNGDQLAIEFGPKKLEALRDWMKDQFLPPTGNEPELVKAYARTTINSYVNRIRRCFTWCVSQELIPENIAGALHSLRGLSKGRTDAKETKDTAPVSLKVVNDTLPFLSPTVRTMVIVQYLCGMRPQDICRLNLAEINRSSEVWIYSPAAHKNAHRQQSLVKAIPPVAQKFLTPWLDIDPNSPIFATCDSLRYWREKTWSKNTRTQRVKEPKTTYATRKSFTSRAYGRAIELGVRKANEAGLSVPHWTPNQLRHSIGSHVREESGLEAAQLVLGHKNADVTQIYAETSQKNLKAISRELTSPFDDSHIASRPR